MLILIQGVIEWINSVIITLQSYTLLINKLSVVKIKFNVVRILKKDL